MRITLILILLFPFLGKSQDLINHCQNKHAGANHKSSAVNTAALDYNVSHTALHIDTISFVPQLLKAHAALTIVAEQGPMSNVEIDLLGFDIDSIISSGAAITHTYNDTVIDIQISPAVSQGDSVVITIYYHGTPAQDASGWGGFYFSAGHAFNLGVGFQADPHNYGRAWYPCLDNFTARSRYDFYITTAASSKAFCNGTLQGSVTNPNSTITWHWKLNQSIPSYLASMAVAPYITQQKTSNGIPVEFAAFASDTVNINNTFVHLDTALYTYINSYGVYPFDKVGYCLIPFNSGAMEHASSIHIGRGFINGSQTYATLWAHELSHMWWGDKVTCETAEDMWLNEGFASFNEALYTQVVDGEAAYKDWVRTNHRKVLQFAHTPAQDGSYLTMNNIPHDYTYGMHVYQKGADLVHTMRYYMGDSAFFAGCQNYMNNKAYSHANSDDLRDELTAGSGVNMNRFFDDWVYTPGFPHFSIDSVIYIPGGLDHMFVYTRQRSKGNTHLYEMPIELHFSDGITDTSVTVVIDSVTNMFHVPLYFMPLWTSLDRHEKVSDAIASNERTITTTGVQTFPETNVTLNVQTVGSTPSIIRIEHNFVAPDPFIQSNPGIVISDYHYWTINGIFTSGLVTKATFLYNGTTSGTAGYLDNTLITGTEDSLMILYRQGAGYNWQIVSSYTHNPGASVLDKAGSFIVDTLLIGEYAIGRYDYTVSLNENVGELNSVLTISPNPSNDNFKISFSNTSKYNRELVVFDMGGREIFKTIIQKSQREIIWHAENCRSGIYNVVLFEDGVRVDGLRAMLNRQ